MKIDEFSAAEIESGYAHLVIAIDGAYDSLDRAETVEDVRRIRARIKGMELRASALVRGIR